MNRVIVSVLVMAIVTYLIRVLPMLLFRKKIENVFFQSFLAYVPYAVLAAMTFPDIFTSTSSFASATGGCIVALYLASKKRSLIVVASLSVVSVYLIECLLALI